jgi:hypothetical protein
MCLIISFVHSARNFPINFIVSRMKHNAAAVAWKLDPLLARETCWLVYARIDIFAWCALAGGDRRRLDCCLILPSLDASPVALIIMSHRNPFLLFYACRVRLAVCELHSTVMIPDSDSPACS